MRFSRTGRSRFCLCCVLGAMASPVQAQWQWQAVAASEYVVQGISQSRGDASLQGGLSYAHPSGAFGGVWLAENSLVTSWYNDDEPTAEVDYYAGYEHRPDAQRPWRFALTHYTYPEEPNYRKYRYSELVISTQLAGNLDATLGFNDNLYNLDEISRFYELLYNQALNQRTVFSAGAGYQDLDPLFGQGYSYWNIGISRLAGRFAFDLSYIDTHANARELFGERVTGARWVFSITVSGF